LVIQRNVLLKYLFCGLVIAACTPAPRPSPTAQVAAAATAAATAPDAQSQPADPSQEIVCWYDSVTGSRFRKRYCTTQAERALRQKDDRESGEKLQRKGAQVSIPPTD
jgi:hypothetical protein